VPAGIADAVLMVDAFEVQAPEAMLTALRRDLRLVAGSSSSIGRPRGVAGSHHPEERVVAQAQAAGFHLRERTDLPRQFVVVLDEGRG
jgi:hypothetical protein